MIELGELTDYLGLDSLTTDEETALVALEERAVAFVERETGRHFGSSQTFVEILEGRGTDTLHLNEEPSSITTLEYRTQVGNSWTAITDFELRGSRLIRTAGNVFTLGYEYRATYDFGYTAGQEPGEIRQLVMDYVKLKWNVRDQDVGVEREQVGPVSSTYGASTGAHADELERIRDDLDGWRWPRVA